MAGCKKTTEQAKNDSVPDTSAAPPPPFDPNSLPVGTNPPGGAAPVPPPTNVVTPLPPPVPVAVKDPTPAPVPAVPLEGTEAIIIKGDSFSTLAKKYNVSVNAIKTANPGVDSTRLKIGQKIKIPAASTAAATPAGGSSDPTASAAEKTYVVKSGDNLLKIAHANNVTVKALSAANNLKTAQIKVGQKLKIPSKTAPATAEATPAAASAGTVASTNL